MVYTATSAALAALEVLVHVDTPGRRGSRADVQQL